MNVYETKRYEPDFSYESGLPGMFETSKGGYVAHGDYATLFSELEVVKAERDALAVENEALKSRSIKLFNLGYLHGHESTVEGYFVDVHRNDIDTYHDDVVAEIIEDENETPATDAALAAIEARGEARGVEKLADKLDAEIEQIMKGAFFYDEISSREAISKMVREYAIELREAK